jgi:D-glycero-D-manno-heptose 1,7-bisphosphate phosphatase
MRAVFLDRDGVINQNRNDHVKSWGEFEFIPGTLSAIRLLRETGFQVFVVTNQAAVGRGLMTSESLDEIHHRMCAQIAAAGGFIQDLRYCPHEPSEHCSCRKPKPGMLLDLAARWQIDLPHAYMVGDALTDIEAARSASCCPILVETGRGSEQLRLAEARIHAPETVAANLWEAVGWIVERESAYANQIGSRYWRGAQTRPVRTTVLPGQ